MSSTKRRSISLDYDRDELDIEVNYRLETTRRPSQLGDLDIDIGDHESSSNQAMESIEKQSPIIERELLTTEQQLENFRSRLAMSESVSAVTQTMLDSIRREYNLPESQENEPEDNLNYSSSNDEVVDYYKQKMADLGDEYLVTSSSNENESESHLTDDTANIIKSVNEEMKEKLDELESKLKEKHVQKVIDTFAKESQSQIEKIMMIQNLEEPDEVEADDEILHSSGEDSSGVNLHHLTRAHEIQDIQHLTPATRKLSLSQTMLITEEGSESDSTGVEQIQAETRSDQEPTRKLSISQTNLIEDGSESDTAFSDTHVTKQSNLDGLTPATRKLSISQTRLIEEGGSESDSSPAYVETEKPSNIISPIEEPTHEATRTSETFEKFNILSKSKQYQTFESSSSTNSDLNRQDDFKRHSKSSKNKDLDDDDDDEDDGMGGGVLSQTVDQKISEIKQVELDDYDETKELQTILIQEPKLSISYSSGEVSSDSIPSETNIIRKASEPSRFLNIAPSGIKESESREFLLDEGKLEDDELDTTSANLESSITTQLDPKGLITSAQLTPTNDGSIEDVSITTVIERRRLSDEQKRSVKKESSTEISSEAYETDEENKPPTLEAATLLSSSDQEEIYDSKKPLESKDNQDISSSLEHLEVTVDIETTQEEITPTSYPMPPKSSLYLQLDSINTSESKEPLIADIVKQPQGNEELTLEEFHIQADYGTDSPLLYQNSSCTSIVSSTTSEENLLNKPGESESNIIGDHTQIMSKSLTYLESLVVPTSSNDIKECEKSGYFGGKKDEDNNENNENVSSTSSSENLTQDGNNLKRNSQSLNFNKAIRPMSFTVKPNNEIDIELVSTEQLEQEKQTPTPVENIAGDFFDKRVTSSNEPSIDRLTGSDSKNQESAGEISNESLASYEAKSDNETEVAAAVATALLFSSTIKSQSSDEVKNISTQQEKDNDEEEKDESLIYIQDATPRSFTNYIVLKKEKDRSLEEAKEGDDNVTGIDNPCFHVESDEISSSTESVIINYDYDDTEDQNKMKIKIIQSSLPSKSITSGGDSAIINEQDEMEQNLSDENFVASFNKSVDSTQLENLELDQELEENNHNQPKTGLSLLTERIEPSDFDFYNSIQPESKPEEFETNISMSELRTKDGVLLDDHAFLICTPTPSNQTPQQEKDIDTINYELAQLDKQLDDIEAAKHIVDTAIANSIEKIIQNEEELDEIPKKRDKMVDDTFKFEKNKDEQESEHKIKESSQNDTQLEKDNEVVEEQINESKLLDDLFNKNQTQIKEETNLKDENNKIETIVEPEKSEILELSEENYVEIINEVIKDDSHEIIFSDDKKKSNDLENDIVDTNSELHNIELAMTIVENALNISIDLINDKVIAQKEIKEEIKESEMLKDELNDENEIFEINKQVKIENDKIKKETIQNTEEIIEEIFEKEKAEQSEINEENIENTEEVKIEEIVEKEKDELSEMKIENENDEQVLIEIVEKDNFEEEAQFLVKNALIKSIELLSSETMPASQQINQIQPTSSSIIKTTSSISPSIEQQQIRGSFSPKEVRFSNLISTDSFDSKQTIEKSSDTNIPEFYHQTLVQDFSDIQDNSFDILEQKLKQFDLNSDSQLNISDEENRRLLIEKDQFTNLQNIILTSNFENTFNEMNKITKTKEDETPVEAVCTESNNLISEAKNLIDNVIENAIEKVSIIISDETEDEDKNEKKKKPNETDDHHEIKFKKHDDDSDDDNPDQGGGGVGNKDFGFSLHSSSQSESTIDSQIESQNSNSNDKPTESSITKINETSEKPNLSSESSTNFILDISKKEIINDIVTSSKMEYSSSKPYFDKNLKESCATSELTLKLDNIDLKNSKPLLTSSFISTSGLLVNDDPTLNETTQPSEEENEDDRELNKTLDVSSFGNQDLDSTLSENFGDTVKIKSSSSTSSYFTAISSLPNPTQETSNKDTEIPRTSSIHTSGSSNYMTAAEYIKSSESQHNLSTSDSFYSAQSTKDKKSSSSSHYESVQNSSFGSLNSSYSTLNDNQISGNVSGNLTDLESDEIESQQNASQSSQGGGDSAIGQFNVEIFLKSMHPLVYRQSTENDEEIIDSSSKSSHSTLTDDKKQFSYTNELGGSYEFIPQPTASNEEFHIISKEDITEEDKDKNSIQELVPKIEGNVKTLSLDPTILQEVHSGDSPSNSLSSSSSSLLVAITILNKKQILTDSLQSNSFDSNVDNSNGAKLVNQTDSTSSSPLFGNSKNTCSEDVLSFTSSVLEFEKLEAQCNNDDDLGEDKISSNINANKDNIIRIKRPRDNMGMAELNEEDYLFENLTDKNNPPQEDIIFDDYLDTRNIISHDLNTIYESLERETNSSSNDEESNGGASKEFTKPPSSLENLEKKSPKQSPTEANKSVPGSPTTRSVQSPTQSTSKLNKSSRSSSSSSVKSTDSFENELKQKFKINEDSFFARKQREKQSSPKTLEVTPTTTSALECSKLPTEIRLDSGQSSMTASFVSSSQIQSPASDSNPSNIISDRQLLSNDSFLNSSHSGSSLTTSYMSDLNSCAMPNNENNLIESCQPCQSKERTKKSPSRRPSRTSSSASSSSSTSLNDSNTNSSSRYSTNSSIVTIINVPSSQGGPQYSGEDLPSFKKKSPSPLSFGSESVNKPQTGGPSQVSTSISASNLCQQQQSQTSSNPLNSPKTKKENNSNPNLSSHSHHSNDCYCGKQQSGITSRTRITSSKSLVDGTITPTNNKNDKIELNLSQNTSHDSAKLGNH